MARIHEIIKLRGNQHARNLEYHGRLASNPVVANCPEFCWGRFGPPISPQARSVYARDETFADADLDDDVAPQQLRRIEVDENFEGSQRLGLSQIDQAHAWTVPATAEEPRALS
jgi:hypothetical protein